MLIWLLATINNSLIATRPVVAAVMMNLENNTAMLITNPCIASFGGIQRFLIPYKESRRGKKTLLSCYDVSPDQCLMQANFIDNTLSSINPFKGIRIKLEAIKGKVASNTKPKAISTQRSTSLNAAIYTPRDQEVRELFTATNPRVGIRIGNRTLLPEPNSQGLTRIFNGASDAEVKKYFTELTGKPLPNPIEINIGNNKGVRYSVQTEHGSYNLRSITRSQDKTGPVWTIDIPAGVVHNKKAEIKFLRR